MLIHLPMYDSGASNVLILLAFHAYVGFVEQNLIVEIYTGYKAFSIHSEESFADPHKEFAKISSPECIAKGVITIVLAMFSDIIIVGVPL